MSERFSPAFSEDIESTPGERIEKGRVVGESFVEEKFVREICGRNFSKLIQP
jgi:hypothetical protein